MLAAAAVAEASAFVSGFLVCFGFPAGFWTSAARLPIQMNSSVNIAHTCRAHLRSTVSCMPKVQQHVNVDLGVPFNNIHESFVFSWRHVALSKPYEWKFDTNEVERLCQVSMDASGFRQAAPCMKWLCARHRKKHMRMDTDGMPKPMLVAALRQGSNKTKC